MTKDFLPQYVAVPAGRGLYRPAYRLYIGEDLRMVADKGKPVYCQSAAQAVIAAMNRVRALLNPPITSMKTEEPTDPLGIAAWQAGKEERHAGEIVRVFGDQPRRIVRSKNGREVKVEYRRRRA